MGQFRTLLHGQSVGGYLSYPQPSDGVARLNVNLSSSIEVTVDTCFQCVLDIAGGRIVSEKGCVTVEGGLPAFIYYRSLSVNDNYQYRGTSHIPCCLGLDSIF